jgi:hypothetical protein
MLLKFQAERFVDFLRESSDAGNGLSKPSRDRRLALRKKTWLPITWRPACFRTANRAPLNAEAMHVNGCCYKSREALTVIFAGVWALSFVWLPMNSSNALIRGVGNKRLVDGHCRPTAAHVTKWRPAVTKAKADGQVPARGGRIGRAQPFTGPSDSFVNF